MKVAKTLRCLIGATAFAAMSTSALADEYPKTEINYVGT